MPLPFSLHATGTGKINVGAAPSAEAPLLCFSTCHGGHKDEKPSVFYGIFLEVQKSQTDFKGRARRRPDMRKEIFRAQSAVANTAMI